MPYLFLTLALIGGLIKGFAGKKVSHDVTNLHDGFIVNTVRTLFCAAIGFLVAVSQVGISGFALTPAAFLVCLVSSVFMALFAISWLYAYKSEAYVFLSVFTMLASVITGILGRIVYGDELKLTRILGFVILFLAIYIMSFYNKNVSGRITKKAAITLFLGTLGVSLSDFMQKVYTKESLGEASVFTFYTYFLMLIPQIAVILIFNAKKAEKNPSLLDKRHIIIFFIMSAALYLNVLTKTFAVRDIPATQMYPTLQGANLIFSAILASLLFKEKITLKSVLGIAVALIAVVLMNI
ncbi:MAG: hypothetical protein E7587_06625 [Ruminococcaceae bacterium]|nr:hypothetical protein [Oscillospiraceae bacterium]